MDKGKNLIRSKQKYGIISQNIMRHSCISATAKALYAYLAGFAGSENTAFPGRDLICYEMGLNKDTFSKYMWELQCWQVIEIEKNRGQKGQWDNNLYILDHYPSYVMMDQKEFEKEIWPELKKVIKPERKKTGDKSAQNTAISPCPKFSDTVKNDSPCPKLPDTVEPDPVEPDPVISDTNNNSLNNNSLNNNIINNENLDLIPNVELDQNIAVDVLTTEIKKNKERQKVDNKSQVTHEQVREKFVEHGINDLPEKVIKVLRVYTYGEISKIAVTLQNKKKQGKVTNPVGLLVTHPEVIQAILRDEFLPDTQIDTRGNMGSQKRDWGELYVPPEVLKELKGD